MNELNKDFCELLNSLVSNQTFQLQLTPNKNGESISACCRVLTTAQLRELIETVVDSPLTQASFNSTVTKVLKESLLNLPEVSLNVVDRLMFILETRIQSLSPTTIIVKDNKEITVDFREIKANLEKKIKENLNLFVASFETEGKISIEFGIPLLDADTQLNEEIYKNLNPNLENRDELKKVLGDAFINEIAKSLRAITIDNNTLDLSTLTFKMRLKTIESLPASLIQKVIEYIESYKRILDSCLTIEGHQVTIDGSLFSLR